MVVKRWLTGLAVAGALGGAAAGCGSTTGSSPAAGGSDAKAAVASGGLPALAKPDEVTAFVGKSMKGKKIAWAAAAAGFPLLDMWTGTLQSQLEQLGADFKHNQAGADPQKLVQNAQTLLNEKPDLLILHNQDVSNAQQLIQSAAKAGVYVITVNLMSIAQSDGFVGADWTGSQTALAERMAADCKSKGKTEAAIITGFGSDGGSVLSDTAYKKVFAANGIKVVSDQQGQYDPTKARDIANTVMQQHPGLCGIIGTWDSMMIGAANAVKQAGKSGQVGVYTSDSSIDACKGLADGSMTAAVDYGATEMPAKIVALAQYLLESGIKPGTVRTAVFSRYKVIDKDSYKNDPGACYTSKSVQ
jgi:ribose transport system substrate-binding protein